MQVQKIGAGAVFVGAVLAGMLGAGQASAAPGISIDPGTNGQNTFGIGDRQSPSGATALAKPGNTSVAVSIFAPARADATWGGSTTFGEGNNVLAIGSTATTTDTSRGNNVLALGGSEVEIRGQHDNVVAVAGKTVINEDSHGDNVVTVCGVRVSGQADHITVSQGC